MTTWSRSVATNISWWQVAEYTFDTYLIRARSKT